MARRRVTVKVDRASRLKRPVQLADVSPEVDRDVVLAEEDSRCPHEVDHFERFIGNELVGSGSMPQCQVSSKAAIWAAAWSPELSRKRILWVAFELKGGSS